ncbi:hypothetical protein [Streptomyces sp. ODS05-4]|uniref:hypothetical protein n=1 Tax=Streptomyces sp. ODS05-4 TaxID=2944939 RepID=UPI00210EA7AF|nr:hypothetical protein [Streptomyces sp. ODS05-4]
MHGDRSMEPLAPGTVQRGQLRSRVSDIAWTSLFVILGAWALLAAVGAVVGVAGAWTYVAVASALLFIALVARASMFRDRGRRRL